jgi:hypothetical protein
MDCIGGLVVTMLYGLNRPTAEYDVLQIAPRAAADAFAVIFSFKVLSFSF